MDFNTLSVDDFRIYMKKNFDRRSDECYEIMEEIIDKLAHCCRTDLFIFLALEYSLCIHIISVDQFKMFLSNIDVEKRSKFIESIVDDLGFYHRCDLFIMLISDYDLDLDFDSILEFAINMENDELCDKLCELLLKNEHK